MSDGYSIPAADFSHHGTSVPAPTTDPYTAPGTTQGLAPLSGGGDGGSIHNESESPVALIFTPAPIGGTAQPPH